MVLDPFDCLGLAPRFDLAPAQIEQAYLQRTARLHPDLAMGDDLEAEAAAAALNQARGVLTDPESRAEALLLRLGGPRKEDDRTLPPTFLAEMMEVREEIEAAIGQAGEEAAAARMKWEEWARERRRGHIARVGELFAGGAGSGDPSALRQVRIELNMWRYAERLIEQLARESD